MAGIPMPVEEAYGTMFYARLHADRDTVAGKGQLSIKSNKRIMINGEARGIVGLVATWDYSPCRIPVLE